MSDYRTGNSQNRQSQRGEGSAALNGLNVSQPRLRAFVFHGGRRITYFLGWPAAPGSFNRALHRQITSVQAKKRSGETLRGTVGSCHYIGARFLIRMEQPASATLANGLCVTLRLFSSRAASFTVPPFFRAIRGTCETYDHGFVKDRFRERFDVTRSSRNRVSNF